MSNDKYIHSDVEDKIYSYWEKNELFKPNKNSNKTKKSKKSTPSQSSNVNFCPFCYRSYYLHWSRDSVSPVCGRQ